MKEKKAKDESRDNSILYSFMDSEGNTKRSAINEMAENKLYVIGNKSHNLYTDGL